jgi:hypothetical protein
MGGEQRESGKKMRYRKRQGKKRARKRMLKKVKKLVRDREAKALIVEIIRAIIRVVTG